MHIFITLIAFLLSSSHMLIGAPRNDAPAITPVFTDSLDTTLFIQNTQIPTIGGTLNSVARFSDSSLKNIKNSPVLIDDTGNVQLNGIIKNNNLLLWPSTSGTAGQALQSDGMGGLAFGSIVGGGNVSTALPFVNNDRIIRTDIASGTTNIQQSGVTLDNGNNITGLNSVTATSFIGNLTGSTSLNVLKSGDTMTGTLAMANQNAIDFQAMLSTHFVGLQAPATIPTSYTLALPSTVPTAHQLMRANSTIPTQLEWFTDGGSVVPATSKTIYVTTYGNNITGDGSFDQPYASLAQAVETANTIATASNPVTILISSGVYTENNSIEPITLTADGVSIIGESQQTSIIQPNTLSQNLFTTSKTVFIENIAFNAPGTSTASALSLTGGGRSSLINVTVTNFATGLSCSGTGSTYVIDTGFLLGNGVGIAVNNTTVVCNACGILGDFSLSANIGFTVTGSNANLILFSSPAINCMTGINSTNNAIVSISGTAFTNNTSDIVQTGGSKLTLNGCSFALTNGDAETQLQISGAGTSATIASCNFNGNSALGTPQATCLSVTNNAMVSINGSYITNYTNGIIVGTPSDTSSTIFTASSIAISNCTNNITQSGSSTLNVNGSIASDNKITINDSTNVTIAMFDTHEDNVLTIGSGSFIDTPLLQVYNGTPDSQFLFYKNSLYGAQAMGFENDILNPTSLFAISASATDLVAITTNRTQSSGLTLVSDTGSPYGGTSALRGWTLNKNGSSAQLTFAYQNSDTIGQVAIPQYTVLQLDGVNNQVQFPHPATQLVFDTDTNLYRNSADVLKTDDNFIVGTLTPGRAVYTDPVTNELSSSVTTNTELSYLSGITSPIQTQLNNKVSRSGDTMTGALQLPAGSAAAPSLTFTGSTTTGLSANSGNLSLSTSGMERFSISSGGTVAIKGAADGFTTAGVVHNDASGNLSSTLIVNADVDPAAAIVDTKLATISTAGKVANSATTATNLNTPNAIVERDSNGNFDAGTITAALVGTITGSASNNVLKAGDTMSGTLVLPASSAAAPSLKFSGSTNTGISAATLNTLSFDTNGAEAMKIGPTGTITIDGFSGAAGVVHNDSSGNLSSSLIVNNDITNATISNAKLATISSSNVSGDIVVRDGSGDFSTNMITIIGTTTNPTDVATKAYVDSVTSTGLVAKTPAVVVSSSNVALSSLQTIDGITLVNNDRVLLVGQTSAIQNGLWVAHAGAWTRPTDFATGTQAGEAYVLITSGTVNAGSSWLCNTPTATIDTDPITFAEFSLPNQTTGANVGPGAGQVFQSKNGITLNFRTIATGTHMVVTNNSDNIALSTDATSANTVSTIVARDGSGNFSAGAVTANLTGNASGNVLKAGDSMTGALNMSLQNPINFYDADSSNFIGIEAPATVPSNYTLQLPADVPTASQTLRAGSTTPTDLKWVTEGSSIQPTTSRIIYVTMYGNDITGDGSFDLPYASLAQALAAANSIATVNNPIVIYIAPGTYVENNSSGPLIINAAGISILGASESGTFIVPASSTQTLLLINDTTRISDLTISAGSLTTSTAISCTAGNFTTFLNIQIFNFQTGISCAGTGSVYILEDCILENNSTAVSINDVTIGLVSCGIVGTVIPSGPPANTGISASGSATTLNITGGEVALCQTGIQISNSAQAFINATSFQINNSDIVQTSGALLNVSSAVFASTYNPSDIKIQISGAGSFASIIGCTFNGNNLLGIPHGTALSVTNNGNTLVNSCNIINYTTGLNVGTNTDTATTTLTASSTSIQNCTTNIVQNGTSTLRFNASLTSDELISLNNSTNVSVALFDITNKNILTIGSGSIVDTPLVQLYNGVDDSQLLRYKNNLYGTQAIGFENNLINPTSLFAVSASATDLVAVTTDRTQNSALMLVSDTGSSYGSIAALRGWTINKNGSAAQLAFGYQNSDTNGQAAISPYTVFQLDGVNNQVQLPNAATQIIFDTDTNLYRASTDVLKTDDNFIVGTLTPDRAVITDPTTNQLSSSVITSTELNYLSGVTAPIQTQLNNTVSRSGDTMTGTLQLPAGSNAAPSLTFTGSTTTGLSASAGNLSLNTNGAEQLKISSGGTISIDGFTTAGVVHNDASGNLSTSLIVNADVSPIAAIVDTKLATISTAGKVANSATTATNLDTPNTIVLRDTNGNFNAGTITATLIGSATSTGSFTGSLSGDVTGTQSATVVSFVGGQTAANVASATVVANAATSANTPNTIVKRDANGNFAANTITATLFNGNLLGNVTGSASLNVLKAGDTMTGTLQMPAGSAAVPSIQFTGSTNTGLSAAMGNTLSFDTNGIEQMNISSTTINMLTKVIIATLLCNNSIQSAVPANNATTIVASNTSILLLKPSGLINLNYTITFPPNPTNGQYFTILLGDSNALHAVTMTNTGGAGGATVVNGVITLNGTVSPTATAGGSAVTYIYYSTDNAWYRIYRG